MSRVQKGGAVFKPITKARPRPAPGTASRQASLVIEAPAEPPGTSAPAPHSSQLSIPTPSAPHPAPDASPAQPHPVVHAPKPDSVPVGPSTSPAGLKQQRPPSLAPSAVKTTQSTQGNPILAPSRPAGTPISIGSVRPPTQRAPVPSTSAAPSTATPTAPAHILARPTAPIVSQSINSSATVDPDPAHPSSATQQPPPSEPIADGAESPAPGKKVPRNRKRSAAAADDDDASSTSSKTKIGRGRRSRAPSLPPYDPTADPGEDLDPTVVTMASLCDDTGQGRVSSKAQEVQNNHAVWKKQNREKRTRMRAIMEARKYGRTEQEAELMQDNGSIPTPASITPSTSNASTNATGDDTSPDFDYTQDLSTSRYNVQVRIGPNGETIIDEESLIVNREETDETATYTHVTESDTSKFVNSGTYSKRFRGSRWSAEETEMFYDALMQHGENYELIAYMLPGRDRKSCKNKFKVEDKRNPARINYCLTNGTAPDIAYLSMMTGKDFSGPTPEIRAPERPAIPPPTAEETADAQPSEPAPPARKRRAKASGPEEGLMIVGDASTMVPDFDS